jgi:hypothetical protein
MMASSAQPAGSQRQWQRGGRRRATTTQPGPSPGPALSFEVGGSRTWVRLPNGRFIADLSHVRVTCAFTTRLAVFALAQFDGLEREVSANVRLNYTFRPGSDLFVVFNERRGSDRSVDFDQRAAVVRVSYLTRF